VKVSTHDHLLVSVETAEDFTASFSELLKQNADILEDSSSLVSGRIDAIVEYWLDCNLWVCSTHLKLQNTSNISASMWKG
jgi:hypothetical protein